MLQRKHVPEIDILRAIAITAVVIIHVTGHPSIQLDPSSRAKWLYLFFNHFSAFAVPLFIFISGFVLLHTYRDRPLNKETIVAFYQKRLRNILLPYVIFSIFYFVLHSYNDRVELHLWTILKTFAYQLLTGTAHAHLYFMFVIVQFYLLFPVFLYLMQNERWRKHALWIGAAAQWSYYYLNQEVIRLWDGIPDIFHQTASLFPSYLTYFILGGILAYQMDAIKMRFSARIGSLKRASFWIVITCLWMLSGLYYVHAQYRAVAWNRGLNVDVYQWVWFGYCLLSALVLFRAAKWIEERFPSRAVSALRHLGICSFGVYLLHPFFLALWRLIPVSDQPEWFHLYYAGMFSAAIGVSWWITGFSQKHFAWSWILFGSAPRHRKLSKPQAPDFKGA